MLRKHCRRLTPLLLFALNLLICWRLVSTRFCGYSDSVEPFFYALSDHIRLHWFDLGWFPEWNCGLPFAYTYQPLLHYVVALFATLGRTESAHAFHVVMALLYAAGPVTLFYLVRRLSTSYGTALAAALFYSLTSPSAWLIPAIAQDDGGLFYAQRLRTLAAYGNSPYIAGLTLIPLALLLLDRAVERATLLRVMFAALALIAVPLTNIPAAISLGMALTAYCLTADPSRQARTLLFTAASGVLGYLLAAPFLPPSGLLLTARMTSVMDSPGPMTPSKALFLVCSATAFVGLSLALNRLQVSRYVRFSTLFVAIAGNVVLAKLWLDISVISSPNRFHLLLEMAVATLIAGLITGFSLQNRSAVRAAWVVCTAAVLWQTNTYRLYARHVILRGLPESNSEFKIAQWLGRYAAGARVMVPGSVSFWLNAFNTTPQVTGCCSQNYLFNAPRWVKYIHGSDEGAGDQAAEISIAWLQTLGVRYVAMCGPHSTERYRENRHPDKLNGVLPVRWRDGDDAIFELPGPKPSLAHWIAENEAIHRHPLTGIDIAPLKPYARAVSDMARPRADFQWQDTRHATITGTAAPGTLLSLQIPYHRGWESDAPLSQDALGLLLLRPNCNGPCTVHLTFTGGKETRVLKVLCALTWFALASFFLFDRRITGSRNAVQTLLLHAFPGTLTRIS